MGKGNTCIARREMRDLLPPGHEISTQPMRKDNGGAFARHLIADARIGAFKPTGAARRCGTCGWVGHGGLLPKAFAASWGKMARLSWAGIPANPC
jgi:hypothetical protein